MTTTERYLKFILCVLCADGQADSREVNLFELLISNTGIETAIADSCRQLLIAETPLAVEEILDEIADEMEPDRLVQFVQDAYLMVTVDKQVQPEELAVVQGFLKRVGVPAERWSQIHLWALKGLEHFSQGYQLLDLETEPVQA